MTARARDRGAACNALHHNGPCEGRCYFLARTQSKRAFNVWYEAAKEAAEVHHNLSPATRESLEGLYLSLLASEFNMKGVVLGDGLDDLARSLDLNTPWRDAVGALLGRRLRDAAGVLCGRPYPDDKDGGAY